MKNSLELKNTLLEKCHQFCDRNLNIVKRNIEEIQIALTSETKSSAGDKHETGRAMLQLEREKLGNQLAEISKLKEALSKVNVSKTQTKVNLGSVVYTQQANYFIAISAGELEVKYDRFFAISPATPMGKVLLGKSLGEEVQFRNEKIVINAII